MKIGGPGMMVLALMLGACDSPRVAQELVLPPTSVLEMSTRWAVVQVDGLRLRAQPDQTGRILLSLTEGARVEVLKRETELMQINGETDYWYKVNYNGTRGWTFGAFLVEMPRHAGTLIDGNDF